ncbi:MAG: hypothetical protein J6T48_01575 [Bacteroidales bacterium]|nr:hypothetical protein [Bacteroidales bacterium]
MFQFLLDKDTFLLPQMFGDTSAYKWNLSALDLHEHRESQPHAFACVVYNRLFISMSKIHFCYTDVWRRLGIQTLVCLLSVCTNIFANHNRYITNIIRKMGVFSMSKIQIWSLAQHTNLLIVYSWFSNLYFATSL